MCLQTHEYILNNTDMLGQKSSPIQTPASRAQSVFFGGGGGLPDQDDLARSAQLMVLQMTLRIKVPSCRVHNCPTERLAADSTYSEES